MATDPAEAPVPSEVNDSAQAAACGDSRNSNVSEVKSAKECL